MPGTSPCSDALTSAIGEYGVTNEIHPKEHEMLSELTEAMIVNGVVLAAVLATDLGPARKIGKARLLRPLIVAVAVPVFLQKPVGSGNGLVVELAGVVAGILTGLAAAALIRVYRSPQTGK